MQILDKKSYKCEGYLKLDLDTDFVFRQITRKGLMSIEEVGKSFLESMQLLILKS